MLGGDKGESTERREVIGVGEGKTRVLMEKRDGVRGGGIKREEGVFEYCRVGRGIELG